LLFEQFDGYVLGDFPLMERVNNEMNACGWREAYPGNGVRLKDRQLIFIAVDGMGVECLIQTILEM